MYKHKGLEYKIDYNLGSDKYFIKIEKIFIKCIIRILLWINVFLLEY